MKHLLLPLLLASSLFAKSADDYLHSAAYKYIAGRMQEASVEVDEGLQNHPDDPKLQNLKDLLKQMKDQQRQDQNQGGGGDSKDKKDSKQNGKDQNGKDQKDPNGKGDSKDGQKKDDKKEQQAKQDKQDQDQKSKEDSDKKQQQQQAQQANQPPRDSTGQGQPARRMPGQMSKDEAERLLNSFVDEEKKAQESKQGTPRRPSQSGQEDW